jgi:hypothetical protein
VEKDVGWVDTRLDYYRKREEIDEDFMDEIISAERFL